MPGRRSRLAALGEVLAVFVLLRLALVLWLLPSLGLTGQAGRFLVYACFIAVPLLLIAVRERRWDDYGLGLHDFSRQSRLALSLFLPFAAVGLMQGFLLPMLLPAPQGRWPLHSLSATLWIALLLWISRDLDRRVAAAGRRRRAPALACPPPRCWPGRWLPVR